ncbi:TetR/AcrR family transcriptional regulator [Cryptosporangium arvum]|uniref:Transcriptional regulator n=1 Tax=Cryptosporangium arvum DSM 44712 TaxID=927661 RepID=A0A010YI75_9ACTN|nr:TetR/AcrR family transcriptional regulator [Cryptosporangium arvum]EXG79975.1 transcriptional regulator [Cryptosporangium arvum DSM 44712]
MRADAARNVGLLVAAARALVTEAGPDVVLDEVARRAGVANATLYRHFPTRGDLLVAVYAGELTALCDAADLDHASPGDALFTWLEAYVGHVASQRALAEAAPAERRTELFDEWHRRLRETMTQLLERAQRSGEMRADLTPADLVAAAGGIARSSTDADQAHRLLGFFRSGVATNRDAPAPGRAGRSGGEGLDATGLGTGQRGRGGQ